MQLVGMKTENMGERRQLSLETGSPDDPSVSRRPNKSKKPIML